MTQQEKSVIWSEGLLELNRKVETVYQWIWVTVDCWKPRIVRFNQSHLEFKILLGAAGAGMEDA